MSIERSQVETVAQLARLKITDQEMDSYVESLSNILDLVDQLQSVDTTDVAALSNPLDATQRLRADQVTEANQRENLQSNAPAVENGLFLVPKVIE